MKIYRILLPAVTAGEPPELLRYTDTRQNAKAVTDNVHAWSRVEVKADLLEVSPNLETMVNALNGQAISYKVLRSWRVKASGGWEEIEPRHE